MNEEQMANWLHQQIQNQGLGGLHPPPHFAQSGNEEQIPASIQKENETLEAINLAQDDEQAEVTYPPARKERKKSHLWEHFTKEKRGQDWWVTYKYCINPPKEMNIGEH